MNKTQAALVLAAGVALGTVGKAGIEAISRAGADPALPFVHAVDLRRDVSSATADAGASLRVHVYATELGSPPHDLGEATGCVVHQDSATSCNACMAALAADCVWLPKGP